MIDPMLEDALPTRGLIRQKLGTKQRVENPKRSCPIGPCYLRLGNDCTQGKQSTGRNRGGRAFVDLRRRGLLPIVRRNAMWRRAIDEKIGALLRRSQEPIVAGEFI